jgi:hypothetical protein
MDVVDSKSIIELAIQKMNTIHAFFIVKIQFT